MIAEKGLAPIIIRFWKSVSWGVVVAVLLRSVSMGGELWSGKAMKQATQIAARSL